MTGRVHDRHHSRQRRRAHAGAGAGQGGGERYNSHHGVWEGKAATYKVCLDCDQLRHDVDADHDETTPLTWLEDSVFDSGDEELLARFEEIKRKGGSI
jgi:hypothetical protein